MIKKTLSVILFSAIAAGWFPLKAQEVHRCATHNVYQYNAGKYPGYAAAVENAFNYAKEYANKSAAYKSSQTWDTIYRIPVVVHVVYNTQQQNIHDSLIYNQIEVLNQDFRRQNPDTNVTRDIFKHLAADAGIEFFLATTDPDGNPTSGITRTQTSRQYFLSFFSGGIADEVKDDSTGGKSAWDTEKYLNIWVCTLEEALFPGLPFVLGYAYPPYNAPNWPANSSAPDSNLQGVVVHYGVFGRNNPMAPASLDADRGRTTTHEVGHYLGLRHIWGDGFSGIFGNTPDCSVDDGIEDTPNSGMSTQAAAANAVGCDINTNTCIDPVDDLPDMWENYMDYSKEECQNMFTFGQVAVMRAMLATSRSELPEIVIDSLPVADVRQYLSSFDFSIVPNPSFGIVELFFSEGKGQVKITINDLVGKTWGELMIEGNKKTTLNLSDLPKGIYAVTAADSEKMAVKKIILN